MAIILSTAIISFPFTLQIPKSKNKPSFHTLIYPFSFPGKRKNVSFVVLAVKSKDSGTETVEKRHGDIQRRSLGKLILSEGRDEDKNYGSICPGCGVFMQDMDPNVPGFFQKRKVENKLFEEDDEVEFEEFDTEEANEDIVDEKDDDYGESGEEENEDIVDAIDDKYEESGEEVSGSENNDGFNWDEDEWESGLEVDDSDVEEEDGFAPASVGYGNITEESANKGKKKRLSKSERKRLSREAHKDKEEVTVCARCHSLRNYGSVKNQTAENLIPDFDFDALITTRLVKPTGNADSTVIVMVVDCVDFDGSFPKRAAKSLFKQLDAGREGSKFSKKLPKLVLVGTKVDLLPSQVSPTRLDRWVRHRAKALGAPKLNGVYLVSSKKDLGVKNLLSFIKEMAGPRGNVWVIGAQNAGKSTLINAFAKKEGVKVSKLTEAAVPGTTLGILRIAGVLSAKAKMYDTPGLLHPYLMSIRLNREEQKMVELRKELQPRTYRMKAGQTVHVGAVMRLDLSYSSVETIYVSVWASPNASLHMGKTENADEILSKHAGTRLQPPIGVERLSELGNWGKREIKVSGVSWDVNSIDIAVAGLGWFSLGLKGEATVTLYTYDGVEITLRDPLVLDRARFIERPGFLLPKAISEALGNQSKLEAQKKRRLEEDGTEGLSEIGV